MRKRIVLLTVLIITMLAATARAQVPYWHWPTLYVTDRITADAHNNVMDAKYKEIYDQTGGDAIVAMQVASYTVGAEAQTRLDLALEAFRWKDPVFFKTVMDSYGLHLLDPPK